MDIKQYNFINFSRLTLQGVASKNSYLIHFHAGIQKTRNFWNVLPVGFSTKTRSLTAAPVKIREARHKEEKEARFKSEVEARLKAEEETRLKAEVEARLKAEVEARLKAEVEARLKAEVEARLKAEGEARLMAEEEAKAVEERRKKNERKNGFGRRHEIEERCLVEEQMRHVQEEHKMRMKEVQKCFQKERGKRIDEQNQLFNEEQEKSDEDMENETYEGKEETPVDMIKDKAEGDINPVILSKERVNLEDDGIEEEKPKYIALEKTQRIKQNDSYRITTKSEFKSLKQHYT
ncbi:hypothetical protein TNCV_3975891 [Trichonephila clavipes]|nr:hypothetical protein TNCV_3975891 [Trichonephila clavipes]